MPPHLLVPVTLTVAAASAVLVRRFGVPGVVGHLLAGILLGPVALAVVPTRADDPAGRAMIEQLGHIGLCVLLFEVGMRTRLADLRPVWRPALALAVASAFLSILFGWTTAMAMRWPPMAATLAGITFAATSLSITASALAEVGLGDRPEGVLVFSAAVLDGVLGMMLLAVLAGSSTPGGSPSGTLAVSLAQAIAFIAAGLWLGPHIVRATVNLCRWANAPSLLLILAFSYLLALSYAARVSGLAMIIGAYAAGLAFARHREHESLGKQLQPLADLLTPLFFVLAGVSIEFASLDPRGVDGPPTHWAFAALLTAAVLGKWLAPLFLHRRSLSHWLVGSAMIARGGIGFVFAQVGLTYGFFTPAQYSLIALVLASTSILGPALLRLTSLRAGRVEDTAGQSSVRENPGNRMPP